MLPEKNERNFPQNLFKWQWVSFTSELDAGLKTNLLVCVGAATGVVAGLVVVKEQPQAALTGAAIGAVVG